MINTVMSGTETGSPNQVAGPGAAYFAGIARNQINIPKRMSAPKSENSVCRG